MNGTDEWLDGWWSGDGGEVDGAIGRVESAMSSVARLGEVEGFDGESHKELRRASKALLRLRGVLAVVKASEQ